MQEYLKHYHIQWKKYITTLNNGWQITIGILSGHHFTWFPFLISYITLFRRSEHTIEEKEEQVESRKSKRRMHSNIKNLKLKLSKKMGLHQMNV